MSAIQDAGLTEMSEATSFWKLVLSSMPWHVGALSAKTQTTFLANLSSIFTQKATTILILLSPLKT